MHKAVTEEGVHYQEYILLYTDDVLTISATPIDVLEQVGKHFKLKDTSIGPPKLYLGGTVTERELMGKNGGTVKAWGFSSSQYV